MARHGEEGGVRRTERRKLDGGSDPARAERSRREARGGYTLVELLIGLVLFGALAGAAVELMIRQTGYMGRSIETTNARQNVRAALDRVSSDIRVVGRGLNLHDIQVPDLIIPNGGTVSVGTFRDDAISLISIPDASPSTQVALDPAVPGNGAAGNTSVETAPGANLSGLTAGTRMILFDPNTGNSQVVTLTGVSGRTLTFAADPLVFDFPASTATPAQILKLTEVRFRLGSGAGLPYLERKVSDGPWVRYVEGITGLKFTYIDDTGSTFTPTTQNQRRAIRRVDVTITGAALRLSRGGEKRAQVVLTTSVVPRNMLPAP